jgi:colanic acid biosynthesis glycosyl transferase WcaI
MRIVINDFCGHAFQIELSRELARRGHEVLHLFFADNISTPKGNVDSGDDGSPKLTIKGLHIPMKFSKLSLRTRRKADIAYGKAVASEVAEFRPNVVFSANMPLDAQKILQRETRRQHAKFIFWLQDVYSYAVRFVLKRKLRFLAGPAGAYYEGLERKLLKRSDAVICIAPGFEKIATAWGVKPSRIRVIENWAPPGEILPTNKENPWSREHGLTNDFCFVYSGTLGMKHRPELLLALARHLETRGGARLVVIAGGAGAEWLSQNAHSVRKDVLTILPFQPYERLSEIMGTADVLIALLDSDAGEFAVPSKVLSYLCAGRPLLLAAPRENHVVAVVERAQAGSVISPDNTDSFVKAATTLMESQDLRTRYASNARAYAERSFAIEGIAEQFLELIAAS